MTHAHMVITPEQAPPRDAVRGQHARPSRPPEARSAGLRHELDRFAERALGGPGSAIALGVRAHVEQSTGLDLSGVRLHRGPRVRAAARAAGASAFTSGRDIGVAVGPDQPVPARLLTHELVHVAQQALPGAARADEAERQARALDSGAGWEGAAFAGTGGAYVAYAATDWLQTTPDVRSYGHSALLDELTEVEEWISRQVRSSPETDRMAEAKQALTAEIARRQGVIVAQERPRARGRGARGRQSAPAEPELPAQTAMPRVLRESSSTQTTDPAEIRAEVDRITAWLQRPDLSRHDRAILRQELGHLTPGLGADLSRSSAERRQARLAQALGSGSSGDRAGVVANLRMIESIRPYQEQPGMAYVMHDGELLVFPQELAGRVRAAAVAALAAAARQARQLNDSSTYLMNEHLRRSYEEQPYVGFVVSLVSGTEPVELQTLMLDPLSDSNIALRRFGSAQERGSLADMGDAVFTAVEKADQAHGIVQAGIEKAIDAAQSVVTGLTITRNLSIAIALSIGAILAAPVVAAAVAGTGATGLLAVGMTAVGTGGVVGTGGFGLGFLGGAGGELAAGHGLDRALETGVDEGLRVGAQGVAIGVGGGATRALSTSLGVGAPGLSFGQNLWRGMAAQGTGGALSGTTSGLLQRPPEGRSRGDMALRGGLTGLGLGLFSGAAGTYAGTLGSPTAQFAVGVGAPSLAAGGVTYAQTGNVSESLQAGAVALTVGALGRARANQRDPAAPQRTFRLDARGNPGAEVRAHAFGRSVAGTARSYALAAGLGLHNVAPAFRMGHSGGSYNLSDPRASAAYVARPAIQAAPSGQQQAQVIQAQAAQGPAVSPVAAPAPLTATPSQAPAQPSAPASLQGTSGVVAQQAAVQGSAQATQPAQAEESFADVISSTAPSEPLTTVAAAARESLLIPGVAVRAGSHASAREVRAAWGLTGAQAESAHVLAQTMGAAINRVLPPGHPGRYSAGRALAVLLPRNVHRAFDQGWVHRWNARVRTGQRTTVGDVGNLLCDAIEAVPPHLMTAAEKGSFRLMIDHQLFQTLDLSADLVLFGGP